MSEFPRDEQRLRKELDTAAVSKLLESLPEHSPGDEYSRALEKVKRQVDRRKPTTFSMLRREDATGVSGTGVVAHVVHFPDGRCVSRWLTELRSVGVYDSLADLEAIHGHGGSTLLCPHDDVWKRGTHDAYQDCCEGCGWMSLGQVEAGTGRRPDPLVPPKYISEGQWPRYLAGYLDMMRAMGRD